MSILQAIILGIVQGIAEFLPVSSSGHLAIVQNIFHIETDGGLFFDVMLHLGTLVAIFVVYRKDILRMIIETLNMCGDIFYNLKSYIQNQRSYSALRYRKIVKNNYRKFVVLVLVSTIPTGVIGYMGRHLVEKASATLIVPGICLILTSVLLIVSEMAPDGKKIPRDISYGSGFLIGAAQGCATLPGLSRSGTTIAACMMSGYDRRFAVRYSFIMSIPAILGAALVEIKDIGSEGLSGGMVLNGLIGAVVAGCVGYVCIKTMLSVVRKKKFKGFAIYCFVVGVIAIIANFFV
ncbi:MAG: undecaprenyl-diphosphate phosphatase [Lachnospiraceae bacterium]|jgi:undecaprenyl-diphosphatase|nr:undecaprenyl-diphosphate phosphatase [Lachnospiraceae bacterium]